MASAGRRVLIIVQNLPVPFDRRVWLEATTLQSSGYQVSVICPKLKGFNKSHETIEDVEVFRYRMPFDPRTKPGFLAEFAWAWLATLFLSIRVAIQGRGFDLIHACNPPETYWALALIWRLGREEFHLRSSRPFPGDVRSQIRSDQRPRASSAAIHGAPFLPHSRHRPGRPTRVTAQLPSSAAA